MPGDLHLGIIRSGNISSLNNQIGQLSQPASYPVKDFQDILKFSEMHRESQKHAEEEAAQARERQLRVHGRLIDKSDLIQNLSPLKVIYVKSQLRNVSKMNQFAALHGPCVVLSVNPHSSSIYVYGLLSGQVMKKSYRQIRAAFEPQIFNLPLFQYFCKEVQFKLLEKEQRLRDDEPAQQLIPRVQRLIVNLHQLLSFLSPILPSREQTVKIIDLDKDEDLDDDNDEDTQVPDISDTKDIDISDTQDSQLTPQVKFTTDTSDKPQTKTPRIKDAYQIPDLNDDDGDDDNVEDSDDEQTQTFQKPRDREIQERERPNKYSLRRNPQPKKKFSELE